MISLSLNAGVFDGIFPDVPDSEDVLFDIQIALDGSFAIISRPAVAPLIAITVDDGGNFQITR